MKAVYRLDDDFDDYDESEWLIIDYYGVAE